MSVWFCLSRKGEVLCELWIRKRMRVRITTAAYALVEVLCERYAPDAKCALSVISLPFFGKRGEGKVGREKWNV